MIFTIELPNISRVENSIIFRHLSVALCSHEKNMLRRNKNHESIPLRPCYEHVLGKQLFRAFNSLHCYDNQFLPDFAYYHWPHKPNEKNKILPVKLKQYSVQLFQRAFLTWNHRKDGETKRNLYDDNKNRSKSDTFKWKPHNVNSK